MNLKKFEYTNKDIPFLRRDVTVRLIFSSLFIAVFIWQFISLFVTNATVGMTTPKIVTSIIVLIVALMMAMVALLYSLKDLKIISAIKKRGTCVSTIDILFSLKKGSFIKLYQIVAWILAIVSLFILLCSLTYSILQFAYFSSISYYLPILVLVCIAGFNSVFHINSEIKTIETVKEYHSYY